MRKQLLCYTSLRRSKEFRHVYVNGERIDGRLMTVFLLPNKLTHHRLGITASRKAVGNAVERNRVKRLLRVVFRAINPHLRDMDINLDWVLNAKRGLVDVKAGAPLEELQRIVSGMSSNKPH